MFKLKLSTYCAVLAAIAVMVLLYGAQKGSEEQQQKRLIEASSQAPAVQEQQATIPTK
ncbi:hypothetical protein [Pseudomonas sp. 460]|uniref:hypothetical protein n=1 Tax=Pseudomonas sp. 460 TaxID=2485142 RepID=UPI0010E7DF80|nr:hypothetical protein [Pseudomonas sp. 460]TCV51398.1 hypothetical protein EDB99_10764 [Pseudomonas sp. 460]